MSKIFSSLFYASMALVFITTPAFAGDVYKSNTELVTALPIGSSGSAVKKVVYSYGPLSIPAGATVDVRFQAQLTNDCGNNVGVMRYIIRTVNDRFVNGTFVTPAAIENVTPDEHHGIFSQSTIEKFNQANSGVYYNVIMYAISSAPECNGSTIAVDGGGSTSGGELVVEIR